ncbi:MAG: hypothetical protein J5676_01125 [Bacteroidaceae bacterium]|nr:hypothetical protein [Bacteroidaceae bacterium]
MINKHNKAMWKETKVVKNVGYDHFDARCGAFASTDKDKKSILYINGKEIAINKILKVTSYDDKIIVFAIDDIGHNDALLFTKDGELINKVKCTAIADNNTNLRYLNIIERKNHINYFNLVEFETGKAIFKDYIREREFYVFNNMIFSNRDNIIIRHDWDGSILWQHDYQQDFNVTIDLEILSEAGVCGGKLWVKSRYERYEILLAIDVNTGELLKAFSDSENDTNFPHCKIGNIYDINLNNERDKVLVTVYDKELGNHFVFLDAKNLVVEEKRKFSTDFDDSESEKSLKRISDFRGDYITIKLEDLKQFRNAFGFMIYNYRTKEIVFAHRLFTSKQTEKGLGISFLSQIQYLDNGRIFIHDFADRLHIFEDVKE